MPPRKTKSASPTPVDAITHNDKRANLPTADAEDFVAPEIAQPIPVRYPRDPTLDPQLVWKGKDELDGEDLIAEAPPIYIQEKIDPRVLIENLRDTAARPEDEPELTLFETFDGLDELDLVEFYEHDANWSNRMILGDSLNVMASLAEREALRGKVQMIYIDPPYGIRFGSNWQASARKREVKDGKLEDIAREVEQIKAFRDTWEFGIHSYLSYLRDRLVVAHDLLTETGSVFVQIGDENVHLVRALMDEVFGSENFMSLITFRKTSPLGTDALPSICDYLVWYATDRESCKIRTLYNRKGFGSDTTYTWVELAGGDRRKMTADERAEPELLPSGARPYAIDNLRSSGYTATCFFPITVGTQTFPPQKYSWKTNAAGVEKLKTARRIQATKTLPYYVRFHDDFAVSELNNVWLDTRGEMSMVYVVQTTSRVIERCLLMTSDPGDLVLDPACGSGTTAAVAEQWGRRWITIDTSRVALALARQRLMGARFPYYLLADSTEGRTKEVELITAAALPPSETANDIRHGFVYERVQHVTLKSIANNPDIHEGMGREEIDAAIRRHAEYELLYDKPYEDKRRVRVSGPFTVESLSPHRSLAFAGSAPDGSGSINAETVDDASVGDASFEQTILANLRTAGIQNGRKDERLTFDTVDPYAATYSGCR